jgi:ubiquinone/menaquinone biosynthesis C-methylase UbiE
LLPDRISKAKARLPHLPLSCADGQAIPYPTDTFDLVMQYTVFSSILDNVIKSNMAQEMLRVLKPHGMILWYDLWLNPTNPQTKGIRPKEIRSLFPNCEFDFRKITLAPPIARHLVPISWLMSAFLEKLTIFNTHYLVAIRPNH